MQIKKKGPYSPEGASEFSKRIIKECMALHPNDRMRLKDLRAALESGQLQSSLSRIPTTASKKDTITRPTTQQIAPTQLCEPSFQNFQFVQQQQTQQHPAVGQSIRRAVRNISTERVSDVLPQDALQQMARNTFPAQMSNGIRAQSMHQPSLITEPA